MTTLPAKDLFRVDEVATYFDVTERTIRLWIEHGHLTAEKIVGTIRIPREAVLNCRIKIRGNVLTKRAESVRNQT